MRIKFKINGQIKEFEIKPNETLLDLLRREGYRGVKEGCREGHCGACTVLINGTPVQSCLTPGPRADGKEVLTVEGLGTPDNLHPLQKSFLEEGAVQCGYCTPGMLLSSKALLDKNPKPSEEEIRRALDGNLCRCTGYVKIIEAIKKASRILKKK